MSREYIYRFDYQVGDEPPQHLYKRWKLSVNQAHNRMWRMLFRKHGDKLEWMESQRRPV